MEDGNLNSTTKMWCPLQEVVNEIMVKLATNIVETTGLTKLVWLVSTQLCGEWTYSTKVL